jgi:MFS transporter, FHS family, glucose/mannose:H+ symporter
MPTSGQVAQARDSHRISTLLAHATFVPTGAITVLLGPLLPVLSAKWGLSDTRAGYLITAQFVGALVSTVTTSALVPRWGFRRTIAAGQILMAVGVATLMAGSFGTTVVSIVCYGAGIGFTIPTVNLMIARAESEHRSSALNLLNFSWSAGAVACPIVVAFLGQGNIPFFLHGLAAVLVVLAILVLFFGPKGLQTNGHPGSIEGKSWFDHFADPAFIVLSAIFFLYVGTENGLSAWLASFAKRETSAANASWAAVPSYFFAALLLGRIIAPIGLRRWGDHRQSMAGLGLALASIVGLLSSHSIAAIALCAFLTGLGLSTLYPIAIGLLSSVFGSAASRVGGWMFALSSVGGASVPWVVGFASTQSGTLRVALLIPLMGCALMLVLYSSPRLRSRA